MTCGNTMKKRIIILILAVPLLPVVGLVALLATPAPAHVIEQAKHEQTERQLQTLSHAITCMEIDGLPSPQQLNQLDQKYYEGPLIDSWKNPIHYDPTTRTLASPGPDSTISTEDDIVVTAENMKVSRPSNNL